MMRFFRHFGDLGINGVAARWYDGNSRKHRLDELRGYARQVAGQISDGDAVLEIAPGPGYLSIELARMGDYRITGMDISSDFVEIARRNAKEADVNADFRQGSASNMPFADNMFDFIVCTAAFKNFREPKKALKEMRRVLKPGGTALIADMKRNVSNADLDKLADEMNIKGIEALFVKMTFKHFLRRGAYEKSEMSNLAAAAGFSQYEVSEGAASLSTYLRKDGPRKSVRDLDKSLSGN